jgi:hypothetical protein
MTNTEPCCVPGAGAHLSMFLDHIVRWMGTTAISLQQWWATVQEQNPPATQEPPLDELSAQARARLGVNLIAVGPCIHSGMLCLPED